MRRLLFTILLVAWSGVALADDPHAEMAAALAAAIDAHPVAAALPVTIALPKTAATPPRNKVPGQAALGQQGRDQAAAGLARSAQGAAMSAAGQAQAAEAKNRTSHNPHK
jgi:hypothetical protein